MKQAHDFASPPRDGFAFSNIKIVLVNIDIILIPVQNQAGVTFSYVNREIRKMKIPCNTLLQGIRGCTSNQTKINLLSKCAQEGAIRSAQAGYIIPTGIRVLGRRTRVIVKGSQAVHGARGIVNTVDIVAASHSGLD